MFRVDAAPAPATTDTSTVVVIPLAPPATVTVTPSVAEGHAYTYAVYPMDASGNIATAYTSGTTASGPSALSATKTNTITWDSVPGVTMYAVYRNGSGFIGTTNANTLVDTGTPAFSPDPSTVNATGEIRIYEPVADGSSFTAFKAQAQAADVRYTLPAADGSAGEALKTDGSGTLSWGSLTPTPAGTDKQVQFNDGGSLAGNDALKFDKSSGYTRAFAISGQDDTDELTISAPYQVTPSAPPVDGAQLSLRGGSALAGSNPGAGAGGLVLVAGGDAARNTSGDANGGDVWIGGGLPTGTGTKGKTVLQSLTELRDSTTPMRFSVFKTYTGDTNYECVSIDAATDPLAYQIGSSYGSGGGSPRQLVFGGGSLISDVAPELRQVLGKSAYSRATTNTTGGNLVLAGGIGRRFFTVVTFGSLAGKTVTLTANGTAYVLTEGVEWSATASNNQTATNLATAINAHVTLTTLMTATAVGAIVYLDKKTTLYSLTLTTNAGAPLTATSGADGQAVLADGVTAKPALSFSSGTTSGLWLRSSVSPEVAWSYSGLYGGKLSLGIAVPGAYGLQFQSTTAVDGSITAFIISPSSATIQLGASNSATPVAQTFQAQGSRGGTDADVKGANLTQRPGAGTGTAGGGDYRIQRYPANTASGTTANTASDAFAVASKQVTLTESSATPVLDISVPSGSVCGGCVMYTIRANDATDFQALTGRVRYAAVNKGGVLTANVAMVGSEVVAASAGTLTNTVTVTTGVNLITINLNAVSSLTQTTLYAYVQAEHQGTGSLTTK